MEIKADPEPRGRRWLRPPPRGLVEALASDVAELIDRWNAAHDRAQALTAEWRSCWSSGLAGMYGVEHPVFNKRPPFSEGGSDLDRAVSECRHAASGNSSVEDLAAPLLAVVARRGPAWCEATAAHAVADVVADRLVSAARTVLYPKAVAAAKAVEGEALGILAGVVPHNAEEVGLLLATALHEVRQRWRPLQSVAVWAADPTKAFALVGTTARPDTVQARVAEIEKTPLPVRVPAMLPAQGESFWFNRTSIFENSVELGRPTPRSEGTEVSGPVVVDGPLAPHRRS